MGTHCVCCKASLLAGSQEGAASSEPADGSAGSEVPPPHRVIFALGISMTFINVPVEWFSIGFDWTWMLLFGDIRQGVFYAVLLSFWVIFCGEHMMVSGRAGPRVTASPPHSLSWVRTQRDRE